MGRELTQSDRELDDTNNNDARNLPRGQSIRVAAREQCQETTPPWPNDVPYCELCENTRGNRARGTRWITNCTTSLYRFLQQRENTVSANSREWKTTGRHSAYCSLKAAHQMPDAPNAIFPKHTTKNEHPRRATKKKRKNIYIKCPHLTKLSRKPKDYASPLLAEASAVAGDVIRRPIGAIRFAADGNWANSELLWGQRGPEKFFFFSGGRFPPCCRVSILQALFCNCQIIRQ